MEDGGKLTPYQRLLIPSYEEIQLEFKDALGSEFYHEPNFLSTISQPQKVPEKPVEPQITDGFAFQGKSENMMGVPV